MKPTILALAAVLLLGSCRSLEHQESKRAAKARAEAEKHLAKAILADPSIMQPVVTTDTITLYSDPVVITERLGYSQASMDSLASICADLLRYERERKPEVVKRLVATTCNIDTAKFSEGPVDVMVWAKDGVLDIAIVKHAEALDTAVTTSVRNITASPCPPKERVKSWAWLFAILGAIVGFFLCAFMRGSHRHMP